jgi:hypothetical protein
MTFIFTNDSRSINKDVGYRKFPQWQMRLSFSCPLDVNQLMTQDDNLTPFEIRNI